MNAQKHIDLLVLENQRLEAALKSEREQWGHAARWMRIAIERAFKRLPDGASADHEAEHLSGLLGLINELVDASAAKS